MSKITQKNKELKGKQAKIAKSKASKTPLEAPKPKPSIPNLDKCCTCTYRHNKLCKSPKSPSFNSYVPRKHTCPNYNH